MGWIIDNWYLVAIPAIVILVLTGIFYYRRRRTRQVSRYFVVCATTGEKCRDYGEYLKTNHFNMIAGDAYLSTKGKCYHCGRKLGRKGWVAHHLFYYEGNNARKPLVLGREPKGCVVPSCTETCHGMGKPGHVKNHKGIVVPPECKMNRERE